MSMSMPTSETFIGRISHFFTDNRPLSYLLLISMVLFGLVAFWLLPKQYNPEITRPAFVVSVAYDDVTATEAVDRVSYELIEKVQAVPGVDDIVTEITDGSVITSTVIFEVGYDATKAKVDLLSQIDQHSYLVQGTLRPPAVQEINPETIPILQIAFSADAPLSDVRQRVIELSHEVLQVADVSDVTVYGGYEPAVLVEIDPVSLAQLGVTVSEVTQALQAAQVRTVATGYSNEQTVIETVFDARLYSLRTIEQLAITPTVRVQDVARVYLGDAERQSKIVYDSATSGLGEVVLLAVSKREGSSAPVVSAAVLAQLDAWTQTHPDTLSYAVVGDDGATAQAEIRGLTINLITSVVIVVLVLLLFLSTRAALVVLVAIPLTLLIVFGVGWLFGETINRITLFALILSLGLLVDAAIVVTENIYRHLSQHPDASRVLRARIIARAVGEVGTGLALSLITSVIVFLPMGYITGMMGPYMGPIAFFVPAALTVSFVVAIVVTPFISSLLLKVEPVPNRINVVVTRGMDAVTSAYTQFLRVILGSRRRQRLLLRSVWGLLLLSMLLPLTGLVHFQMLPRADQNQLYVYVDMPDGTSATYTYDTVTRISSLLREHEAVTSLQWYVGTPPIVDFNGLFKGVQNRQQPHQATARVNLVSKEDRALSSSEVVAALREQLAETAPEWVPLVRFMEEPPGPPVQATLVAKVQTTDASLRRQVTEDLAAYAATSPLLLDVDTSEAVLRERIIYQFNREAAEAYGVPLATVAQSLSVAWHGVEVSEYQLADTSERVPVRVGVAPQTTLNPSDFMQWSIPTQSAGIVPLQSVVTTQYSVRPATQRFEGAVPVTYVTAEVADKPILYATLAFVRGISAGELAGYELVRWSLFDFVIKDAQGSEAVIEWGGEWEMTLENFRDLGLAMIVALLLVYAVLVAQYNSFAKPAFILVTVPLGLIGILWGFLVLDQGFGIYLTATALIGFIALIGIVVNNAIIFLEYVEQMQAAGADLATALTEAGTARLRPILLTSLTTVLGSLTIAGDPVWSGLAWAIVFGLSLSTILTLVIYPVLLMYFTKPRL